ncbi:hypothetical protein EON64_16775 [archaeon]|nr:MAG: hypothetical protein EON64_16775 [archaeon]
MGARYFDTVVMTSNVEGTRKWYRRDDGNHWRAVASHLLDKVAPAPWFQDPVYTSKKIRAFHFDTRHRKEEMVKYKKARNREWMMKMYRAAMENKENEDEDKYVPTKKPPVDEMPQYIKFGAVAEEKMYSMQRDTGAKQQQHKHDDLDDLIQWR